MGKQGTGLGGMGLSEFWYRFCSVWGQEVLFPWKPVVSILSDSKGNITEQAINF